MTDWNTVNCRECRQCNRKGRASAMKGSKYCLIMRKEAPVETVSFWANLKFMMGGLFQKKGVMRAFGGTKKKEEKKEEDEGSDLR